MRLQDFLDAQNIQLRIIYYPNQKGRWSAKMEHCCVAEDGFLSSTYGDGVTPADATRAYLREVCGKRMKIEGDGEASRYFIVPEQVEYP